MGTTMGTGDFNNLRLFGQKYKTQEHQKNNNNNNGSNIKNCQSPLSAGMSEIIKGKNMPNAALTYQKQQNRLDNQRTNCEEIKNIFTY